MLKKTVWKSFSFLLFFSAFQISAQQVLSSAGTSYTSANLKLDFTLGEVVTFTGSSANNIVTQGFHQPVVNVQPFFADNDGDGFGNPNISVNATTAPVGYVADNTDCNDNNAGVNPGATEICNGIDDNCNSIVDDVFLAFQPTFFPQDSWNLYAFNSMDYSSNYVGYYNSAGTGVNTVSQWAADVSPSSAAGWNGCAVDIDNHTYSIKRQGFPAYAGGSTIVLTSWDDDVEIFVNGTSVYTAGCCGNTYVSAWSGALNATSTIEVRIKELGGVSFVSFDVVQSTPGCTDANACNYDASATSDDGSCVLPSLAHFYDFDADGYGSDNYFGSTFFCTLQSAPWYLTNTDCNDNNPAINPGAAEVCNTIDDNCDGQINEGFGPLTVYYADADGDGYGNGNQLINVFLQGGSSASVSNGSLVIVGSNTFTGSSLTGSVSFVAPVDATYSFDWSYSTNDDGAFFDPAYYINGTAYPLTADFGPQIQSGTQSVNVPAGGTFGFSVVTFDDLFGSATLTISNFNGFSLPSFTQACSQPAGYALVVGDCNDAVATINPGATENCATSVDDNCNGLINEGCLTPGENPSNATSITPSVWPACSAVSGTLIGASASSSALTVCLTGEDKWHQFVATSEGVSIVVNSTAADIVIELQTAAGVLVAQENAVEGLGGEILNHYGLTAGQVYKVGVRNFNSALGTGTYSICAKMLKRGGCDYGPGPYTLCQYFKATWAGAAGTSYTFTFTGTNGPGSGNVYTRTQNSDICILSNVLPTLPYGSAYNVLISNTFTINNGAGVPEVISVPALAPCLMNTAAQPVTVLRVADRCTAGPRFRGSVVASLPWVCGANNWRWEFTELNAQGNPVGLPIIKMRGAASNYINLGTVSQLQYGKTYSVRTAPIFSYTGSDYQWGTPFCLSIVGSAGMIADGSQANEQTVKVETTDEFNMSLYPNPTHGTDVNINLSGITSDNVQIRILDAMGKQVWSNRYAVNGVLNTNITFERPLANGLYFVEAIFNGEVQTQRMMVQK